MPSFYRGDSIQRIEYYPFGKEKHVLNNNLEIDPSYTGQLYDKNTGLYYYKSRYYNPKLARFIQPDTMIPNAKNLQSYNRYSYVENNPLKYTDPTGHSIFGSIWNFFFGGSGGGPGTPIGVLLGGPGPDPTSTGMLAGAHLDATVDNVSDIEDNGLIGQVLDNPEYGDFNENDIPIEEDSEFERRYKRIKGNLKNTFYKSFTGTKFGVGPGFKYKQKVAFLDMEFGLSDMRYNEWDGSKWVSKGGEKFGVGFSCTEELGIEINIDKNCKVEVSPVFNSGDMSTSDFLQVGSGMSGTIGFMSGEFEINVDLLELVNGILDTIEAEL